MVRDASWGIHTAADRSQSSRALDRRHARVLHLCCFVWHRQGTERQWRDAEERRVMTELFVIWARILRGVLEAVCRASGETAVREDACLNIL